MRLPRRPCGPPRNDESGVRRGGGGDRESNGPSRDGSYPNTKLRTDSEIVDRMLDSIYLDCMGKTLIDALDHDITITTDTDLNRAYPGAGLILFAEGKPGAKNRSYVLLEELTHAYQRQNLTKEDFNKRKLNLEIEAKVGWLMYEKRKSGQSYSFNQYSKLLGNDLTDCFQGLCDNVYPNYDKNELYHVFLYEGAIATLRTIKSYKDRTNYPESGKNRNFDFLKELMKNCQE